MHAKYVHESQCISRFKYSFYCVKMCEACIVGSYFVIIGQLRHAKRGEILSKLSFVTKSDFAED